MRPFVACIGSSTHFLFVSQAQLDKLAKRFTRPSHSRDEESQMAPPRFATYAVAQKHAGAAVAYYNNVLLHYHLLASRRTDDEKVC